MLLCPYCGCHRLIKNGSTRGVPKWKCKSCGRQTSLRGRHAGIAPDKHKKHVEAVLLYLSGLSLNAIAFLKSVVASTILNWVRQFARQWAAKPKPGPEGVIVMELDEIWHFVGHEGDMKARSFGSGWPSAGIPVSWSIGNVAIAIKRLWTSCWHV